MKYNSLFQINHTASCKLNIVDNDRPRIQQMLMLLHIYASRVVARATATQSHGWQNCQLQFCRMWMGTWRANILYRVCMDFCNYFWQRVHCRGICALRAVRRCVKWDVFFALRRCECVTMCCGAVVRCLYGI